VNPETLNGELQNDEPGRRRFYHLPVLVEEVMALLKCGPGKTYVDATLGGGGHAFEILSRTGPDGILIGVEWDEESIIEAKKILLPFGDRVRIYRENFICLPDLLRAINQPEVDGILFDLGLSTIQLDRGERGFSFQKDGPLDMRMDQRKEITAGELLNQLSQKELENTLLNYGEERWAKRIAEAILREREVNPILTTQALRRMVHQAIPKRFHSRKIDPATKTFQALRIRVNDELENLKKVLETGWKCLKRGGRICIISFHSLEDRLVKEAFRFLEQEGVMKRITKKPILPSLIEKRNNPRSRSARLRCAERL